MIASETAFETALRRVPRRLGQSGLLRTLSERYARAPSAVIIRVAEAELLRALPIQAPALDLCCGDGFLAGCFRPEGFEAGCDISPSALDQARRAGHHRVLKEADVARRIPFDDSSFATVVSNSALEHVRDLDGALREVRRVLRPGGRFCLTCASSQAYEWWPCGGAALRRYERFQPVFNILSLGEWTERLARASLRPIGHAWYLTPSAVRVMLFLDYHYSNVYLTPDPTYARPFIGLLNRAPAGASAALWRAAFGRFRLRTSSPGGGILIAAEPA